MGRIFIKVARLFWATLVCLVIVKLTTFGWNIFSGVKVDVDQHEKQVSHRLRETVEILSKEIGVRDFEHPENLHRAAKYIEDQFRTLGYFVSLQTYEVYGQKFRNIIATLDGNNVSAPVLIIGAHYDSCHNPGADDNASGIAGLLELARQLKGLKSQTPVWLAAFTNEEPPFFTTSYMGSRVLTQRLKIQGQKIKGAVILEMLGYYSNRINSQRYLPVIGMFYPNRANFIAVVSNFASRHLKNNLMKGFKQSSDFPIHGITAPESIPGIYFSDHWSFWQENYPAIMVTDTAFLRNPHYHQNTDLPDTLNYEYMAKVVNGLKHAIEVLVRE